MRRPAPHVTEVARRIDDARAEVILPDAVGEHARRQRIVRMHNPVGESAATIGLRSVGGEGVLGPITA